MPRVIVLGISLLVLSGLFALITGYLQWYVLRPYTRQSRWWILVPLMGLSAMGVFVGLRFSGVVYFDLELMTRGFWPTTEALCFCLLKRKWIPEHFIAQSSLALAPDLTNYWQLQKLQDTLYRTISKLWNTDLETSLGTLSYLIGSDRLGIIIAVDPLDQLSADQITQTPLATIGSSAAPTTPLAKFQLTFIPPGTIRLASWRGVPLIGLGVTIYAIIFGMSLLLTWLQMRQLLY
jgi:hypothetical protein